MQGIINNYKINNYKINGASAVTASVETADRLFHCDAANQLYELNLGTFAIINNVSAVGTAPYGIGGTCGLQKLTIDSKIKTETPVSINYLGVEYIK